MLPILLFEVTWKLLWLGIVALPLWLDDDLDGATRTQAGAVLWVVVIIAVIPWRHVFAQFVIAPPTHGAGDLEQRASPKGRTGLADHPRSGASALDCEPVWELGGTN